MFWVSLILAFTSKKLGIQHETHLVTGQHNSIYIPVCWPSWLYYFLVLFFACLDSLKYLPIFLKVTPILLWRKGFEEILKVLIKAMNNVCIVSRIHCISLCESDFP